MRNVALAMLGGIVLTPLACAPDAQRRPRAPSGVDSPAVLGQGAAPPVSPVTTTFPSTAIEPTGGGGSNLDIDPLNRSITPSLMRARPISGGTLRILADGRTAVASDSDRDQVYVVDLVTAKLLSTIALAPGDEPGRLAEDDAGRVHVALRRGGAVVTIDPARGTLLARRALCAAPRGLAYDTGAKLLHVACAGGELVSIDAAPTSLVPARTVSLDRDLRDVVVKGDKLLVSTFRSSNVLVVGADGAMTKRLTPGTDIFKMSAAVAWRMLEGPGDKTTVLHQRGQDSGVSTAPGGYAKGLGCGSIVTSTTTVITPGVETVSPNPNLTGALVAADAAFSPDGSQMAVVSIGGVDQGQQLQFYSTTTNGSRERCQAPMGKPTPPGDEPDDGADDEAAHTRLPRPADYLPPNGQVVAVAYDRRGNVIVQSREPASLQILTQRLDPVVLAADSRFDVGHQVFHTATTNRIACVSCHPEGGEDGRVWTFQNTGPRRTQSLRGGIMNTAPFHWSGDETDFSSLMADVFRGRMGGGEMGVQGIAALGKWLNEIPTIPPSRWADDATVGRGRALFKSAGCGSCHAGGDFTSGLSVDVGTGGLFQVPQLHGLGFRAPYMHDGCAGALRDRFSNGCGGDNRHGAVSALSSTQVGDLVSYLDTL